ncbi:hypothetical protein Tco_0496705, partial [Tanacetum coccineum]
LESLNETADDNPYDIESEIKFIKRFKPLIDDEEPLTTSVTKEHSNIEEDSDLESIPDDEVGSPSSSQTLETEEDDTSADKPSDPLGHLQEEITSLSNKVDQLESNITKKLSEPNLIAEALKQQVPGLITETLKTTLPLLLKDLIKDSITTSIKEKFPVFDTQLQQTLNDQLPKLIIKPMNKELIAFNKLEANRFIHLQKELSKVIQNEIGRKVKTKVRTGMYKVTDRLDSLLNSTKDNSENISDLKQQLKTMTSLLEAAKASCLKGTLVIHTSEEKVPKEKTSDDEPPTKRLKVLIPTPTPLRSIFLEPTTDPTPPKDPILLEMKEKVKALPLRKNQ